MNEAPGIPLTVNGAPCTARPGETVLDAALRAGLAIPFSCRGGVCHACLLRGVAGDIPAEARRGLADELTARGYLLACQCRPTGPMALEPPDPAHLATTCLLHGVEHSGDYLLLRFETARTLPCRPGQTLLLPREPAPPLALEITAVEPEAFLIEALLRPAPGDCLPDGLHGDGFGREFSLRGPLDAPPPDGETAPPATDPGLWAELGNGATVRAVLEDFYTRVYQDPQLAPFFEGVTRERSIDKQYSFLQQLMTGERLYFGDRPRNAHHWMVISDALFHHRQALMHATQQAHGLTPGQMARWSRLELHYRADIVKDAPWPRRLGDLELPLDGFGEEVLGEASVCDYCQDAIPAGTRVRYHLRLGKVSCPACGGAA